MHAIFSMFLYLLESFACILQWIEMVEGSEEEREN